MCRQESGIDLILRKKAKKCIPQNVELLHHKVSGKLRSAWIRVSFQPYLTKLANVQTDEKWIMLQEWLLWTF